MSAGHSPVVPGPQLGVLGPAVAGMVPAPMGRRLVAALIDSAPMIGTYLLALVVGGSLGPDGAVAVLMLAVVAILGYTVYLLVRLLRYGDSLGLFVQGLRWASQSTGGPPTLGQVFVRGVVASAIVGLTCGLGSLPLLLSFLWDKAGANRLWSDRAGTMVLIDVRHGPGALRPPSAATAPAPVPGPPTHTPPWPPPPAAAGVSAEALAPVAAPPLPPAPAEPAPWPAEPVVAAPTWEPATPERVIRSIPGVSPAPPTDLAPPPPLGTAPQPPIATPGAVPRFAPGTDEDGTTDEDDESTVLVATTRARFELHFDVGFVVEVQGRGLIGRNPSDLGTSEEPLAHLVPMDGSERSISKTHLEFGQDGPSLWVRDLHSTNGVFLDHSGARTRLPAGQRTTVPAGATIRFGNRRFAVEGTHP